MGGGWLGGCGVDMGWGGGGGGMRGAATSGQIGDINNRGRAWAGLGPGPGPGLGPGRRRQRAASRRQLTASPGPPEGTIIHPFATHTYPPTHPPTHFYTRKPLSDLGTLQTFTISYKLAHSKKYVTPR